MSESDERVQDRIREVAYFMWERAGRLPGMAQEYWVAAEKEVLAALRGVADRLGPGERPKKSREQKVESPQESYSEERKPSQATTEPAAGSTQATGRKAASPAAKPAAASKSPQKPKLAAESSEPSVTSKPTPATKAQAEPKKAKPPKTKGARSTPSQAPANRRAGVSSAQTVEQPRQRASR